MALLRRRKSHFPSPQDVPTRLPHALSPFSQGCLMITEMKSRECFRTPSLFTSCKPNRYTGRSAHKGQPSFLPRQSHGAMPHLCFLKGNVIILLINKKSDRPICQEQVSTTAVSSPASVSRALQREGRERPHRCLDSSVLCWGCRKEATGHGQSHIFLVLCTNGPGQDSKG